MKGSAETPERRKVLIIGAGPAGLTAGYELVQRGFEVTILESDGIVGGISRTVQHNGFRFDIGGHRFFSKNETVERWWKEMLGDDFLDRPRLSRWHYRGKFFDYPIRPFEMLKIFGFSGSCKTVLSYLKSRVFPIQPERSLADWCENNFGHYLAKPFFIDYNLKLWGIHPSKLSKNFASQRIRGVSFSSVIKDRVRKFFKSRSSVKSFIETFHYPKYGPGQMWETVAKKIREAGGTILIGHNVRNIRVGNNGTTFVQSVSNEGESEFSGDYILSTMPLKELVASISPKPPEDILLSASRLSFRDFITIALMIGEKLPVRDTWIYTHEESFRSIRVQFFQNWSPFMVPNEDVSCIGFEYACSRGDDLWNMDDSDLVDMAKSELKKLGLAHQDKVFDTKVIRMKNVYPTYALGYEGNVEKIKEYLRSTFKNHALQPIGRGGLHQYNNSDHSMMTAFLAVKNINGEGCFDPWEVNSDAGYHEEDTQPKRPRKKFPFSASVAIISAVFVFLAFLRTKFLLKGFWIDEWLTIETTQKLFRSHLANPYHLIIFPIVKWSGADEIGLRSVSVFFNALTSVWIYLTGKKFFGRRAGILASLLFLSFPYSLILSQEVRMYSFLSFLSVIHLSQILKLFRKISRSEEFDKSDILLYFLTDIALLFTHFSSAILLGIEAALISGGTIFLKKRHIFHRSAREKSISIVITNILSVTVFLLWDWRHVLTKIGFFSRKDTYIGTFFETGNTLSDKIIALFNATIGFSPLSEFLFVSIAVLSIIFLLTFEKPFPTNKSKEDISSFHFEAIIFIALASSLYSLFLLFEVQTLVPRHFFITSPSVAILLGVFFSSLCRRSAVFGTSAFLAIFSVSIANSAIMQSADAMSSTRSWNQLSTMVKENDSNADAIFVEEPFLEEIFSHYYTDIHHGNLPVETLEHYKEISDNDLIRNDEIGVSFFTPEIANAFMTQVRNYRRVILVRNGTVMSDRQEEFFSRLLNEYTTKKSLCLPEGKNDLCAIFFEKIPVPAISPSQTP